MSPPELTSRERRRLLRRMIWQRSRWSLLGVAVLLGMLLRAMLLDRHPGWLPASASHGPTLLALALAFALLRGRRASLPLLRRLPVKPADEFRARFEVASCCGLLVLAPFFAVQLLDPPVFSLWSFLDATARFFCLFVFLLSLGTSLGWRSSGGFMAELFSRWELLIMYFIPQLLDWIWTTGNDVYYGLWVWEPLKRPLSLVATGLFWLVIHWRRAAHGSLLPGRLSRATGVISNLLFFSLLVSIFHHISFFAWFGQQWKLVQSPEELSPSNLKRFMIYLWVLPALVAFSVASYWTQTWKRRNVLISRLPSTPRTVARERLGALVRLWVALILIPAFFQLFFTHVVASYPLETSVASWEWLLALSLVVLANIVLSALVGLLASRNSVVAFVGLGLLILHLWLVINSVAEFGNGSGFWSGPVGLSLLVALYTALGMWMLYESLQRCLTPKRLAVPEPQERSSPPAITASPRAP